MNIRFVAAIFVFLFTLLLHNGCQTTYYAVWEKLGKEKRHLLGIWGHHTSLSFERGNIVENWYGVPRFRT